MLALLLIAAANAIAVDDVATVSFYASPAECNAINDGDQIDLSDLELTCDFRARARDCVYDALEDWCTCEVKVKSIRAGYETACESLDLLDDSPWILI